MPDRQIEPSWAGHTLEGARRTSLSPTMTAPARSYSTWASPGWEKKLARRWLRVIGAAGGRGCSTDGSASAKRLCTQRTRRRPGRGRRRRQAEEQKLERTVAAAAAAAGWAVEAEAQALSPAASGASAERRHTGRGSSCTKRVFGSCKARSTSRLSMHTAASARMASAPCAAASSMRAAGS